MTTWAPTEPGDSFFRLFTKAQPGPDRPLVILLDEFDLLVDDILQGRVQISDACPMALEITSKKSMNHFFDAFDREVYKYVILVLTSNRPEAYFQDQDASLSRAGRMDLIREL